MVIDERTGMFATVSRIATGTATEVEAETGREREAEILTETEVPIQIETESAIGIVTVRITEVDMGFPVEVTTIRTVQVVLTISTKMGGIGARMRGALGATEGRMEGNRVRNKI